MNISFSPQERELLARDDVEARRFAYRMLGVFALVAAAAVTVGFQAYAWLTSGQWPAFTFADALQVVGVAVPQFPWAGVQRVVAELWRLPFSVVLFLFALLGRFVAIRSDKRPSSEAMKSALQKRSQQSSLRK